MALHPAPVRRWAFHPIHVILLAAAIPLFAGALLADIAYSKSHEIQWTIFSSWLIAGGLVILAFALVAAIVPLFRADGRGGRRMLYFLLVLVTWVLGVINALVHAKDAWAVMPAGLVLSIVVAVLACAAAWIACLGMREVAP